MANTTIYCFRNDLRLSDNPAFLKACSDSDFLLPLFCHPKEELFKSNIPRIGIHRQFFLRQALDELKTVLNTYNSDLIEVFGDFAEEIKKIAETIHATKIIFEKIEAPEELDQENSVRNIGINVESIWQSSMIAPSELPFKPIDMPDIFTDFRKQIEVKKIKIMALLKQKHEIENYEMKAKLLRENGLETWYHDDNWIKTEWIDQGKKYDMMGRDTDDVYNKLIEE